MASGTQFEFPFASLDFPGRTTIKVVEMAARLGVSWQHVVNGIDSGEIAALDVSAKSTRTGKAYYRIPAESYRAYVIRNVTGPVRDQFISKLPESTRRDLFLEIGRTLPKALLRELIDQLTDCPSAA